jgi:hypothetical protein
MTVYALRVDGTGLPFYTVQTVKNQGSYIILGVAPGTYYLLDGGMPDGHFGGAYTKDVPCGLAYGCNDHSLIPVIVAPGQNVIGISVTDWYAPPDSFPLVPAGGPSPSRLPSAPVGFPTATQAAVYEAQRGTGAPYLAGAFGQCPTNRACVTLGDERDGTHAAFLVGQAGSNNIFMGCAAYVVQDSSGWQPLNTVCGTFPAPGVSLAISVMGSGCINVQASPSLTSAVVGCIPIDSTVTVDQGPVFVEEPSPPDTPSIAHLWWHLAGHGWMSHQYLSSMSYQ